MTSAKGIVAAEISRGFFDLQLYFADVLAAKAGMPLAEAITFHTNLHRVFAYGNLAKMAPAEEFIELVRRAAAITDPDARLDILVAAFAERPFDPVPADRFGFGCFACEAPNAEGRVRIHFGNRDSADGVGPLHATKTPARRAELTAMFGFVAKTFPDARAVDGASWLYNTEGYRRLFPPEFAASRTPLIGPRPIHGLSSWGQFLDYRGYVRPAISEAFRQNLKSLDPRAPWLAFPLPVLKTTAPFDAFRREYGV